MPIEQSQNIKLAPNDSLFLFIEVTINPNNQNTPFLVSNQLEFTTNGKTQLIELVAFGQNANFYTPMLVLFLLTLFQMILQFLDIIPYHKIPLGLMKSPTSFTVMS